MSEEPSHNNSGNGTQTGNGTGSLDPLSEASLQRKE